MKITEPANNNNLEDEIDIKSYLKIFKRNIKKVILITGTLTFLSIVYSFLVNPLHKGRFTIVVADNNSDSSLSSRERLLTQLNISGLGIQQNNKSQELILKSESVLMPVFDYVKNNKQNPRKKIFKNTDLTTWRKKYLTVWFEEGTNILTVTYTNYDKDFILNVLNLISEKYKSYSIKARDRDISNYINYLESQKDIYLQNSLKSQKELTLFSIENGLGDIDGFVEFGNPVRSNSLSPNFNNSDQAANSEFKSRKTYQDAPLRYQEQFNLLASYESRFVDLSSHLKPSSKTLSDLKIKIENLKKALKRPNEILLEHRELIQKASRDEETLINIENNLILANLEKAKQKKPWEMIAQPSIDLSVVWPQKKLIVIFSFLFSLLSSFLYFLFRAKVKGKIFGFYRFKNLIDCKFIDELTKHDSIINTKLIESFLSETDFKKHVGILHLNKEFNFDKLTRDNIFNSKIGSQKIININQDNINEIDNCSKIFILVYDGITEIKEIFKANKIAKIYSEKIVGWLYIN